MKKCLFLRVGKEASKTLSFQLRSNSCGLSWSSVPPSQCGRPPMLALPAIRNCNSLTDKNHKHQDTDGKRKEMGATCIVMRWKWIRDSSFAIREHKLYSIQPVAGGRLDTNLNKWGWPGDARNIMWERISCSAQSSQTWTHPKALINPSQSYIQGSGLVRGISLQHSRLSSKLFGWTEAFPSEHFLKLKAYQLKNSILPKRKSWVLQFNARV